MKNIAIVTGASSGIGRDFAIDIAKNFDIDEIWIIARRKDRLIELAHHIYENYLLNVVVIPADLTDYKSIEKISQRLEKVRPNINILVNSSGFGLGGESINISRKSQENMIMLNCISLFSMTQMCMEYMSEGSGIIQISSAAAFSPQPFLSVYSATKSFVLNYSLALSYELKPRGINVSVVCPGPVDTEFFDVCFPNSNGCNFYKNIFMKKSKNVVNKSIYGYLKGKKLIIPGFSMKILAILEGVYINKWSAFLSYKIFKRFN